MVNSSRVVDAPPSATHVPVPPAQGPARDTDPDGDPTDPATEGPPADGSEDPGAVVTVPPAAPAPTRAPR